MVFEIQTIDLYMQQDHIGNIETDENQETQPRPVLNLLYVAFPLLGTMMSLYMNL